jgi:NADP-dependent 3-hydroxy acid dehydrogenase YdfG
MNSLEGKIAVVTGASRGIGRATASALSELGLHVVLVARGREALEDAAGRMRTPATVVAADLADPKAVDRAIESILKTGTPSILVNNAGIFPLAALEKTTPEDFGRALNVNLFAPFLLMRALLPAMKKAAAGHIVTIGSIADRATFPEKSAYAATKFGARAMHEVLRAELRGTGVRATLVSPGPVDTDIWNPVDPDNRPGFTPRAMMLPSAAVASAVIYALSQPAEVNIDELRLSRS